MLESKLQKKIIALLELQGYYCLKIIRCNKNGFPDLIAFHKSKKTLFIEVKAKNGVIAPLQLYRQKELQELNKISIIVNDFEEFRMFINNNPML